MDEKGMSGDNGMCEIALNISAMRRGLGFGLQGFTEFFFLPLDTPV